LKNEEKRKTYRYLGEARKIGIENLDPCIGVGFVLKNGNDLLEFEKAFSSGGLLNPLASFFKK
jgi:hypothetical protein